MKFVATKTAEQLDLQALHRVRERLGPISKSPEEDDEASELDEAEEVLGVILPAHKYAAPPLDRKRCSVMLCTHLAAFDLIRKSSPS